VSERVIARVFPRRTNATPTDSLAFVGGPPLERVPCDEVHVSCTFTWDQGRSERLAGEWEAQGYNVRLGGPAFGSPAEKFEPGRYVKPGMTFTSRGCIRRCPFCFVPKREGPLQLLKIVPGWDILDNNLLACPREHVEAVLDMLEVQPRAARFTGGIDVRLCQPWFARRLGRMRVQILYTAYDAPGARPAAERCIKMLRDEGLSHRQVGCYVLVGQEGDTTKAAEERLRWLFGIGATPFAMFYRPPLGKFRRMTADWQALVRRWIRPACIFRAAAAPDARRQGLLMPDLAPGSRT